MTIHQIRNRFLRRVALVLTVASILICLGPLHLCAKALKWVEDEFEVDLRRAWGGK